MAATVIFMNEKPKRSRTKSGAPVSVKFKTQRVKHTFDPEKLTRGPAEAVRAAIAAALKKSGRPSSPETKRYREAAERAYRAGKQWARERYRQHAPNQSDRVGFDSGRMAEELETVRVRPGQVAIVVPDERMMSAKIRNAVPELRDPQRLYNTRLVKAALAATERMIVKVEPLR